MRSAGIDGTTLNELRQVCADSGVVDLCTVFGSAVSGRPGPASDVDLAVWTTKHLSADEKVELYGALADKLDRELDVVWMERWTDPTLAREVTVRGQPVFEKREGLYMDELSLAARRYMDAEIRFRQRNEQLKTRIKELTSDVS
ncbi:MAG: nucleotidyltransferase domain-containing protein [Verrucomicrobia bacterium]|nr:nucleotidyltransferase domain-containing protein [Verrucomicrobiota bacterium]